MAIVQSIAAVVDQSGFKKAEAAFKNIGQAADKATEPLKKFGNEQDKAAEAVQKAQQKVNEASVKLLKAKSAEVNAAERVTVAEKRLADAREKFGDDSDEVRQAEKKLESARLDGEAATINARNAQDRLTDAQREAEEATKEVAQAQDRAADEVDNYEQQVQQADRATGKFTGGMRKLGKVAAVGAAIGLAAAAAAAFKFAKASVDAASEAAETRDKVAEIFGPRGSQVLINWSETASTAFGQSSTQALNAASTFALFAKAAGKTGDDVIDFSQNMTVLASDLASFYDTSPEDAIQAIGAALRGESEPIRKYNVLLNDAVLKQAYFEETGKRVTGVLTPQQKVLAAQAAILQQTSVAQGNFTDTSDGLANSQRTLQAVLEDVQREIGGPLLGAVTKLVKTLGPIIQDLAGPISSVAASLGEALGAALEALAPLLPPLALAFANIAEVLGETIGALLTSLIPVLTPVLQLFAELAQRIGPILGPILAKIGELLGAVLDAVLPLLDPLANLILDLLEAASPIIEIVVDALILLVNALKPMFTAIGNLLGPLGELIFVLFEAMAPTIEPLMPILTVLADMWGKYMVFQIGLLTVAIGLLIQAFSKIAPFILNKVTIPAIKYFTQFAEGVINAADAAFGWVPGMGDKLDGAREALVTWRDKSVAALEDAKKKIGDEGAKIGEELVENGRKAMLNPESLTKSRNAGMKVAYTFADGMAAGVAARTKLVANEAARMVRVAEEAARREARTGSPSKLFAEVGKDIVDGFSKGVRDNAKSAVDAVVDAVKQAYDKAREKLKEAQAQAQADFDDFASTVQQAVVGALDFSGALSASQAEDATTDFLGALNAQADKAEAFADRVRTLIAMGISEEALREVIAAGAESGTLIADQLIAGGQAAITGPEGVNALVADVNAVAKALGTDTAANWYQSGVDQANAMLAAFEASFGEDGEQFKKLRRLMKNLGKRLKTKIDLDVEAPKKVIRATVRQILRDLNLVNLPDAGIDGERANGGPVLANHRYLVGERGAEIFVPSVSGSIIPNSQMMAAQSGDTFQITVNAGMGTDGAEVGRQIVDVLKKYERRNGPVWASA